MLFLPDVHPEEQPLTYESVLLSPGRNTSSSSSEEPPHDTMSYAQIDIMLERMFSEVERQEKLFSLDLDVLDNNSAEHCVNQLILEPSTDALIEIPIKKPKMYETSQEIQVDDNPYELVDFGNAGASTVPVDNEYDLISFEESVRPPTQVTDLDEIQDSVKQLLLEVEADEAEMLLGSIEHEINYKYPVYFGNAKTASSESLSEWSQDSWEDDAEEYIYEPILTKSNEPRPYPYERYENKPEQIWYEGAYRNLSIVPEEDEENLSLLGAVASTKSYLHSREYQKQQSQTSTSGDYETDTSISRSTDDDYQEKVVKAEVKLLVKTSGIGKNEIEIRSVRDFLDTPPKPKTKGKPKKIIRSHTLPATLTSKFSNLTSKVSCILGTNKNISKSTGDVDSTTFEENVETTTVKPVFTLQRLFVRTPDSENGKFINNLQNSKEQSKSRTELIATTNEPFPLQRESVDLYANTPFLPCYDENVSPTYADINPFTEFITNPFQRHSQVPQAYCDWLSAEEQCRGNVVKTHYSVLNLSAWIDEFFVVLITNCVCAHSMPIIRGVS